MLVVSLAVNFGPWGGLVDANELPYIVVVVKLHVALDGEGERNNYEEDDIENKRNCNYAKYNLLRNINYNLDDLNYFLAFIEQQTNKENVIEA